MQLDRLHEDSHFQVTAELLVKSVSPVSPGELARTRINLTSAQAQTILSNRLRRRITEFDWEALLHQAASKVLESYREGEPVIDLALHTPTEAAEFVLEPFLVSKKPNILFGEGGIGKTTLADWMAVIVASGEKDAGFVPEPMPVLCLDYEDDADEKHARIGKLVAGLGLNSFPHVYYRYCHQPVTHEVAEIQRIVVEKEIGLIVIDSAGPACGGEPEKADPTIRYFNALRSFRVTTLTIAHVTKNGGDKYPYGNVYWWNTARNIWNAKKSQDPEEAVLRLGLYHRKINNQMPRKAIGLRMEFADGRLVVDRMSIKDSPELTEGLPLKDQIKLSLSGARLTVGELAETLDKHEETIRTTLKRNPNDFSLIELGQHAGQWSLKPQWQPDN
jgi:hypothetical protein